MDWTLAIEKNREALKQILTMLVAMVGRRTAEAQAARYFRRRAHHLKTPRWRKKVNCPMPHPPFALRLLRPAESATRRLIILAARGLVVELAPPRIRKTKPKPLLNRRNGYGTGVVIRPGPLPDWARALAPKRSSSISLPLLDPLKRFGVRRRSVKPTAMPRISFLDSRPFNPLFHPPRQPDPVPLPLSPDDPLDAARLHRRIEALGSALDDLPRQAKRLARWQARRAGWTGMGGRGRGGGQVRGEKIDPAPVADAARPTARLVATTCPCGGRSLERTPRPRRLGARASEHVVMACRSTPKPKSA